MIHLPVKPVCVVVPIVKRVLLVPNESVSTPEPPSLLPAKMKRWLSLPKFLNRPPDAPTVIALLTVVLLENSV